MGISDNQIANDAIDFINNYPDLVDGDGNISDESIVTFTRDLEKFLDGMTCTVDICVGKRRILEYG